jgi:hypothetical protein
LLMVIGAPSDLHLLRTIGALQLFLVLIAGTGLAVLWREAAKRWHWGVAAAATLLLLVPAARERYTIVASLETLGRENTRALDASLATLQSAEALGRRRGGRMYAGLSDSWGAGFLVGYTPVASYLVTDLVPVISGMYNGSSLVNDLIPRFNEANPGDYRLFNIRTMLTPPVASLPAFLKPAADWGKLRAFEAPGEGYFALVDTVAAATVTRETFFSVCDPWMHSPWAANDQHILLDFAGGAGKDLPRVTPGYLPPLPPRAPAGRVLSERQSGQRYEAEFEADRPAYVLFRMAWHPNWLVLIDGAPVQTVMLSPGFTGAPVAPGRHRIVCRYAPGNLKLLLLGAGLAVILLLGFLEHHRSDPKPRPGL